MKMPEHKVKASIIIRTKNEERWINHCLKAVFEQTETSFEVIVVDNQSDDHTRELARRFPVKIVDLPVYKPGLSLNEGIRQASGEYIVCLSAHCIPRDKNWLVNLLRNFEQEEQLGGVYGRQVPVKFSSDADKRDLMITFGLDRRVQIKDTFFHNANSALPRALWEEVPFDETLTNIEDRAWAQAIVEKGYRLVYEPEAEVYHHHGIHHGGSEQRSMQTVRILESLHADDMQDIPPTLRPENAHIVGFVPTIGPRMIIEDECLQIRAVKELQRCPYINAVCLVSDDEDVLKDGEAIGAIPIHRGADMVSGHDKSIETTLTYALNQYEQNNDVIDSVVFLNAVYPFRPHDFFKKIIEELQSTGVETTLAARPNYGIFWVKEGNVFKAIGADFRPRSEKDPIYHGVWGMGGVTTGHVVRGGKLIGETVNLVEFEDDRYTLRADSPLGRKVFSMLLVDERLYEEKMH